MRNSSPKYKKVKFICTDPDATESSSSDEEESKKRSSKSSKVFVYEVQIQNNVPEKISRMGELRLKLIKNPNNKYKYMGVRKEKGSRRFYSNITDPVSKKRLRLGSFDTPEEAAKAYTQKRYEFEARQGFSWVEYGDDYDTSTSQENYEASKSTSNLKEQEEEDEEEKNESKLADESDMKEVNEDSRFGYYKGFQIMDENGFMVGEYAKIDDLRICNEEGLC